MVANVANHIMSTLLEIANQVLPEEETLLSETQPFVIPKRALVVPTRFIGDNILLIPFLRNLSHNMGPLGQLDIVATPATASLYRALPFIKNVHVEMVELKNPRLFLEEHGYDTLIMTRYAPMWAHAAIKCDVPQRVGYDLERWGIHRLQRWGQSLTHTIPSTSMQDERQQVDIYLDILRSLGMQIFDEELSCTLTDEDHEKAQALLGTLPGGRPRVLIHAGSGSPGKQWPIENWDQLLGILAERYNPVFIAVGGESEKSLYKVLEEQFDFYNFCGQSNLCESLVILNQVDFVISLDTSIAHMAAMAESPRLVVLYGPTNHAQWRPWIKNDPVRCPDASEPPVTLLQQVYLNLACRPCLARTCEDKKCIFEVSPEHVLMAVEKILAERPFATIPAELST